MQIPLSLTVARTKPRVPRVQEESFSRKSWTLAPHWCFALAGTKSTQREFSALDQAWRLTYFWFGTLHRRTTPFRVIFFLCCNVWSRTPVTVSPKVIPCLMKLMRLWVAQYPWLFTWPVTRYLAVAVGMGSLPWTTHVGDMTSMRSQAGKGIVALGAFAELLQLDGQVAKISRICPGIAAKCLRSLKDHQFINKDVFCCADRSTMVTI